MTKHRLYAIGAKIPHNPEATERENRIRTQAHADTVARFGKITADNFEAADAFQVARIEALRKMR